MKLYKCTILPKSNFATRIKGDTLFGHICWYINYLFGEDRLKELLKDYESSPFVVVSDAFPSGYLPKPAMPSYLLGEDPDKKKENRKKRWLKSEYLQKGNFEKAEAKDFIKTIEVVHNSLNYLTFSTDDEGFAPYSLEEFIYLVDKCDIYVLFDENKISSEDCKTVLDTIGNSGFGKDASTGKGLFDMESFTEVNFGKTDTFFDYMTLSPCVLDGTQNVKSIYYDIFTRFGKLGGVRVGKNPFKKPVLMADTGAIIRFNGKYSKKYVGKSIKNISTYKDVVHQGYSVLYPLLISKEKV